MTVLANSAGRVTKYAAGQLPMTPDINGGTIDGAVIGGGTAAAGSFTTVSATGQITSTVTTGTAPLVIASTTAVANLNASLLLGGTWAIPGSIGATTPNTGAFTTLSSSGLLTMTVGGKIPDDQKQTFGTDNDFNLQYDSVDNRLEILNASNTLLAHLSTSGGLTLAGGITASGTGTFGALAVTTTATITGTLTVTGDEIIGSNTNNKIDLDNSGNMQFMSRATIQFSIDVDNNDADTRSFIWYKNGMPPSIGTPVTLMTLTETGDLSLALGDLAVNGGDITSSATTFNLLTATVTTLNMGTTAGAGTVTTVNGRTVFDATTTTGQAVVTMQQDDADEPFYNVVGTSAANTTNNITTFTTGATVQGHFRIAVNGTDFWLPYYSAPTS